MSNCDCNKANHEAHSATCASLDKPTILRRQLLVDIGNEKFKELPREVQDLSRLLLVKKTVEVLKKRSLDEATAIMMKAKNELEEHIEERSALEIELRDLLEKHVKENL